MARQRGRARFAPPSKFAAALTAAAIALAAVAMAIAPGPWSALAHADVNDFVIESFDADYTLGRDDAGRSTLHTVEHIVAVFPDFDQNRGLIRDIPRMYDGHDTEVSVIGVTDETGAPRGYTTEPYGDFLAVTIAVPEGSFVHGAQHYVIEYTQRDVTRYFEDTGADEFYWDINGTDWAQPFGHVSASLTLDDGLAAEINGNVACYRGVFGSDQPCATFVDGTVVSVEELGLGPGENVTLALGFKPGTFTPVPEPEQPFFERLPVFMWAGFASIAAGFITFVFALISRRSARTGRAIIAQYEPPEGVSVALASELLRTRSKTMTATLLDFAVRRKLRLLHHEETDQYGAQAVDGSGLLRIEDRSYSRIFTGSAGTGASDVQAGDTHWFARNSTRLGDVAAALVKEARQQANAKGLRQKPSGKWTAAVWLLPFLGLGLLALHTIVIGNEVMLTIVLAVGINALIWIVIAMVAVLSAVRGVTQKGALLLDHLNGLREFIRVAEADRIRVLQSASGAEITTDYIVQIYERLLPYAVLFGFEKEWQGELSRYYRDSTPEWVYGSQGSFAHALPIVAFASAVRTAPATRPVSTGSSGSFSSSSGGSSGGGFSGGGGGGGGGRGI